MILTSLVYVLNAFPAGEKPTINICFACVTCLSFSSNVMRYKRRGQIGELVTSLGELGGRLDGNLLPGFLVFSMFSQ